VPGAGAEAPAARLSMEEATRAAGAPTHAAKASGSAAVATPTAAIASVEPSRKRKRGVSTLR
jgi:hypothetical protein